jgi:hypothetical protein
MPDKLFTPASARVELGRVRPTAERMRLLYRALERRRPDRVASDQRVERGYFELLRRLHALLAEIAQTGVRVSDPREGSLEFPARRAGRAVMLCWTVGEDAIAYWKDAGAGVRRPLDDEGPWEEG